MSEYVSFYLKNKKTNMYTPLFSYGGYIRDSFSAMISSNIAHFIYKDEDYRVAKPISKDTIDLIKTWLNDKVDSCIEDINAVKEQKEDVYNTNNSLQDKLQILADLNNDLRLINQDLDEYRGAIRFYNFLLDIDYENKDCIYAGIECFAPDGSDIEG